MDTTDIEKKSLEAHVELCAERYRALELQLDNVKTDIADVKLVVESVHKMLHNMTARRNDQLIGWGITLIGSMSAVIAWLLTTYVFK